MGCRKIGKERRQDNGVQRKPKARRGHTGSPIGRKRNSKRNEDSERKEREHWSRGVKLLSNSGSNVVQK